MIYDDIVFAGPHSLDLDTIVGRREGILFGVCNRGNCQLVLDSSEFDVVVRLAELEYFDAVTAFTKCAVSRDAHTPDVRLDPEVHADDFGGAAIAVIGEVNSVVGERRWGTEVCLLQVFEERHEMCVALIGDIL